MSGNAYTSHPNVDSEDEARSDFKTTTLRFTNNNFIVDDRNKGQRDNNENNTTGFQFGTSEFFQKRDASGNSRL